MEIFTLRGYDYQQILHLLISPLASNAYKVHQSKSYLTQIDAAHTRERLTKIFGLNGIGWGIDWQPEQTKTFETKTSTGKARYHFVIEKAEFWYIVVIDGANQKITIPVTGYSDNDNPGDAMSGATTSLISTGAKALLFQIDIYKSQSPGDSLPKTENPTDTEKKIEDSEKKKRWKPNKAEFFQTIHNRFKLKPEMTAKLLVELGYQKGSYSSHQASEMYEGIEKELLEVLNAFYPQVEADHGFNFIQTDLILEELNIPFEDNIYDLKKLNQALGIQRNQPSCWPAILIAANRETNDYYARNAKLMDNLYHIKNAIMKQNPDFPINNPEVESYWKDVLTLAITYAKDQQKLDNTTSNQKALLAE